MRRKRVRAGLSGARAAAALFALAALLPMASGTPGHRPPAGGPPLTGSNSSLAWAVLTSDRSSVPEGQAVSFLVDFSRVGCSSGVDNSTVAVGFGDGLNYSEPGCNAPARTGHPGELELPIQYWYHIEGKFSVTATVHWADGTNASSNVLVIEVTPPSDANALLALHWAAAISITLAGAVVVAFLVRTVSRKPPELPPTEV